MNMIELALAISCLAAFAAFVLNAESSLGQKAGHALKTIVESAGHARCAAVKNFSASTETKIDWGPECALSAKAIEKNLVQKKCC